MNSECKILLLFGENKSWMGCSKKSVREILNMLKWHRDYEFDEVSIVYIDRPKGFSEVGGKDIEDIGHKFIYLRDDVMIPIHRIVEIKYCGETIWRKAR